MGLGRLARWCVRHRRRVVAAWIVAVVAVVVLGRVAGGQYTDSFKLPDVESQRAFDLLKARFPAHSGDSAQIVVSADKHTDDHSVYWHDWENRFDYVYVLFTEDEAANPSPERLKLVDDGARFQLYKVVKPGETTAAAARS